VSFDPSAPVATFADLVALVRALGLPHATNPEQQAVQVETTVRGEKGTMLVWWDRGARLAHFVHPLALSVPPERAGALLDALARVNFASVLQGFVLDPHARRVSFRFVIPRRPDGSLSAGEVDQAARVVLQAVHDWLPALRAVAMGGAEAEDVLAVAEATRLS
jgi:hypothetical protein